MKQWQTVLILVVLAIGSFLLLRDLENSLTPENVDEEVKELAVGLKVKGKLYNAKNQLQFDVVGDKITEYSNGGGSKVSMAKMRAFDEKTQVLAWEGEAELVQISADKNQLTLNDDVEIIQSPRSDNPLYATGDHIVYFADSKKILGDKPIVLENNEMRHTGRQFKMNLNDGKAHFAGGMHGYFLPSTADADAVLPKRVVKLKTSKNNTISTTSVTPLNTRISAGNLLYFNQIEQNLPVTLTSTQTAENLQAPAPEEAKVATIQTLTPDVENISAILGLNPDVAKVSSIDQLKPDSATVSRLKKLTPESATTMLRLKTLTPESASTGRRLKTLIPDRVTSLKLKTFVPETNTDVFSSETMNSSFNRTKLLDVRPEINRVSESLNLAPAASTPKIDSQPINQLIETAPSISSAQTFSSPDIVLESETTPNYLDSQSTFDIDLDKAYIESLRSEQVIKDKRLLENEPKALDATSNK